MSSALPRPSLDVVRGDATSVGAMGFLQRPTLPSGPFAASMPRGLTSMAGVRNGAGRRHMDRSGRPSPTRPLGRGRGLPLDCMLTASRAMRAPAIAATAPLTSVGSVVLRAPSGSAGSRVGAPRAMFSLPPAGVRVARVGHAEAPCCWTTGPPSLASPTTMAACRTTPASSAARLSRVVAFINPVLSAVAGRPALSTCTLSVRLRLRRGAVSVG